MRTTWPFNGFSPRSFVPSKITWCGVRGDEIGNGYHIALHDPDWSEFDDDDDDKNLVEMQERYAGCYLRARANLHAIKMVLPSDEFARLELQLFPPMGIAYGPELWIAEGAAWVQVIDDVDAVGGNGVRATRGSAGLPLPRSRPSATRHGDGAKGPGPRVADTAYRRRCA